MADIIQDDETGGAGVEIKAFSQAEVNAMIEEQTTGLKSKLDELLGEKKTVSRKAKEDADKFEADRLIRAKEADDYKSLFESSETKRSEMESKYNDLNNSIRNEKRNSESFKLASEMATGPNAELLSEFISRRLDIGDDGKLIVTDANGSPTVSTMADLKKELVASGKYDALLNGTGATGGGATNSRTSGAGISNKKLAEMSKSEKIEYFKQKREG